MKTLQNSHKNGKWSKPLVHMPNANLVFIFGDTNVPGYSEIYADLRGYFPKAEIIGCTTAGEILGTNVSTESLALTAIEFERSFVQVVDKDIKNQSLASVVKSLISELNTKDLKYLLVLVDGQNINGTELAHQLELHFPTNLLITGGLAGDGLNFEETQVYRNEKNLSNRVLLCGFYGADLLVKHGCMGGWENFGPERLITKSDGNILYELDNKPALELYKHYLGKHAEDLPSSALLFPLSVRKNNDIRLTRTILNINENENTMTFAGDVPQGSTVQLMRSNCDKIIDGAEEAANDAFNIFSSHEKGLALLISCVGRRLVLKNRVQDEVEAVDAISNKGWTLTGFYSYGEISPLVPANSCELHNQTMTITAMSERDA